MNRGNTAELVIRQPTYYAALNPRFDQEKMPASERFLVLLQFNPDIVPQRIKSFESMNDAISCAVRLERSRQRQMMH